MSTMRLDRYLTEVFSHYNIVSVVDTQEFSRPVEFKVYAIRQLNLIVLTVHLEPYNLLSLEILGHIIPYGLKNQGIWHG